MKTIFAALALTMAATIGGISPAAAQVIIYRDHSPDDASDDDQVEPSFIQHWNREHDSTNRWGERRHSFGPNDVIRLLERRGYRVRDVDDVGERYLVRASRDGDNLLVSVSRDGEIMGVVHDRY
ncbi:hypothetical protein [Rhizobium sp. BK602]|uniref:hypothetical protein n=1 Tax=Rhizobium sp. BK602 TaxID=2586986 RepID=UPI00161FC498|nr:hypothetical protein [Rhizobium sp. BK602]MBB3609799.1 hypothetical protein [Rhizobium sp. BK602]